VKLDPVIGPIFTEQFHINWDKHLPVMYEFWDNALFYTGGYTGNPMQLHQHIHDKISLSADHFKTWLRLFTSTADELFEGPKTELAKQRAHSIATVMQVKLFKKE
jgi:hemoglobin